RREPANTADRIERVTHDGVLLLTGGPASISTRPPPFTAKTPLNRSRSIASSAPSGRALSSHPDHRTQRLRPSRRSQRALTRASAGSRGLHRVPPADEGVERAPPPISASFSPSFSTHGCNATSARS